MLSSAKPAARPAAAGRTRAVSVRAVAQPSHKRAAAGARGSSSAPSSSGGADAKVAPNKAEACKARAAAYPTWQAMAQHASQTSATPSGFDESMM